MNPIDPDVAIVTADRAPADEARAARRFGSGVLIVLGLLGAWLALRRGHVLVGCLVGAAGVLVVCLALIRPRAALALRSAWMRVAHAVGWFNTRVILTLVYVVVVTLIGLVMKLVRRDPLERSWRDGTYWHPREQDDDPERWRRPF